MDVLTFETCLAVNSEIIKQVTSVGLSLFNYRNKSEYLENKSASSTQAEKKGVEMKDNNNYKDC